MMKRRPKLKALAAMGVVVLCAAACDPGWVNPVVGTGDGTGTVPGTVAVANEQVKLAAPEVISALPGGGLFVYDGTSCTIMKTLQDSTTRIAGSGICGNTGDGGPAIDAEIEASGLGVRFWANAVGDIYFETNFGANVRRIDGHTGTITAVPVTVAAQESIFGGSADPDGSFTYLVDNLGDHSTFTIRRTDPSGHDAAIFTRKEPNLPIGLVRTGVDRYVTCETSFGTSQVLVDIDLSTGTAQSTTVVAAGELVVQSVDANGELYASNASNIVRIDPDGTATTIAGNGGSDPNTSQQIGDALGLNLTPYTMTLTPIGNLLFVSGHVVYDLLDPAQAPAQT